MINIFRKLLKPSTIQPQSLNSSTVQPQPLNTLIELLLVFLIIFTPFAFGTTELWSITLMQLAVFIMALLWLVKMIIAREFDFVRAILTPFILVFTVIMIFQFVLPYSAYPNASKKEFFLVLSYILTFFIIVNNFKTREQVDRILAIIAAVGFMLALIAILQELSGTDKIFWFREVRESARYFFGPFVNKNHFSGYMQMVVPLTLGLLFTRKPSFQMLVVFVIGIMVTALLLAASRAGAFCMFGSLVFFYLFSVVRKSSKTKLIILSIIMALVVVIFIWIGTGPLLKEFQSLENIEGSISYKARISTWQSTVNYIKNYKLFGSGLGTFQYVFPRYQTADNNLFFDHTHNDYLELLAETGLIGFLLVLGGGIMWLRWLILALYYRHDRYAINLTLGGLAAIFAIFLHSFVDFNLHIPANAFLFTIIIALLTVIISSKYRQGEDRTTLKSDLYRIRRRYRPVVLLGSFGLFAWASISVIMPYIAHTYAQKPTEQNLLKSIQYDQSNALYHYKLAGYYYDQLQKTRKSENLIQAINEFQKAIIYNPTNSKYWQSLAWIYGSLSESVGTHADRIEVIKLPGEQEEETEELKSKENFAQKAEDYFKKAISLEPNNAYRYRTFAQYCFNVASKHIRPPVILSVSEGSRFSHHHEATRHSERSEESRLHKYYLSLAVENYKKAVSLDEPLLDEALVQYSKFTDKYKELKTIIPDNLNVYAKVANFLRERKNMAQAQLAYKDGIAYWEQETEKDLKNAQSHFNLAELYYYSGIDWQKAKQRYQIAVEIEPDNLKYHEDYAKALLNNKEHESVLKEANELLRIMPQYTFAYVLIARSYEGQGDYKKAISFLEEMLKKDSDDAELHFWIADRAFYHLNDYGWTFVERHYKKALRIEPDNEFYRFWYGVHLSNMKKYNLAREQFKVVLKKDPYNKAALSGLSSLP